MTIRTNKNYSFDYPMAGCVLALLPTLFLFIFAQKYFIEGLKVSGLKG